jgi:hypothetical protein
VNTLITSGAYVNSEMAAEFGPLPPAMLPLGTSRLIQHQLTALGDNAGRVHLSLPADYTVSKTDRQYLCSRGVEIIRVPPGISLGRSILTCLSKIPKAGNLAILHGDTLLSPPPLDLGVSTCLVAKATTQYAWGYAIQREGRFLGAVNEPEFLDSEDSTVVLTGYFHLRDAEEFAQCLRAANGDFLTALARLAISEYVKSEEVTEWSDFGHLQTYYHSRANFASARSFNSISLVDGTVKKTSENEEKVRAEVNWYRSLPPKLRPYTARLIDDGEDVHLGRTFYSTEYESLPTLQELFVFAHLSKQAWDEILASCCRCLEDFAKSHVSGESDDALIRLTRDKTLVRLGEFERSSRMPMGLASELNGKALPSVWKIAEEMIGAVERSERRAPSVMHGDFCFSNVLYNARTRRVRLIDPRGTLDGSRYTVAGDPRYDMAKLAHSVEGLYDLIVTNQCIASHDRPMSFKLEFPDLNRYQALFTDFTRRDVGGVAFSDPAVMATTVLLFLSMLPLHSDRPDRQRAFLANALRLYDKHFNG